MKVMARQRRLSGIASGFLDNATLGGDTLLATVDAVTLPLEPGQQYQRLPFSVSLPLTGLLPEGDYFVIASTDALGNQPESHEDNNTFTAGPIRLAYPDLPDLQVIGLTVVETPPTSGAPMTIRWQTANNGPIASVGSFNERVTVVNTDTGATLLNTIVSYDASTSGSIAAGGFAEREHAITLPEGPAGAGTLLITVITDVNSQIVESYGLDLPETNNEASFSVGSEIRPYPDLIVVDPTLSPSSVELGGEVTVAWKTQNIGTADVETSFTERIQLVNKTTGQTILEQIVTFDPVTDGAIAAGTVKERALTVTIPDSHDVLGELEVTVHTDFADHVYEHNAADTAESNNESAPVPWACCCPILSQRM